MTADTCPTCKEKDDQVTVLVEALETLLEAGPEFGRCVCGRKFFQEHRRGCAWIKALHVHADIPAAARERAEERERLREELRKLWPDHIGEVHGLTGRGDAKCPVCNRFRTALAGEKAE